MVGNTKQNIKTKKIAIILADLQFVPVLCWSRYLSQVFPEPGNEAKATSDPGTALIPELFKTVIIL